MTFYSLEAIELKEHNQKCCVCLNSLDISESYTLIKHLDNGLLRIYTGHKHCLPYVNNMILNGYKLEFDEYKR